KPRAARLSLEALECRINPVQNVWTAGAATNDWSLGGNWSLGVPVNGQDLLFPDSPTGISAGESRVLNNDLANLAPGSITFANNTAANAYTLNGNAITLGGASDANTIIANAGALNDVINFDVRTTGAGKQTIQVNSNASLTISGHVMDAGASAAPLVKAG